MSGLFSGISIENMALGPVASDRSCEYVVVTDNKIEVPHGWAIASIIDICQHCVALATNGTYSCYSHLIDLINLFLARCIIQFQYTDKYPEEAPIMEITNSENLEDDDVADILTLMNEQVYIYVCVHTYNHCRLIC